MKIGTRTRFAVIPEWILDAPISAQAVRIYGALDRYANRDGACNVRQRVLATRVHLSDRTVRSALQELVDIGAVGVRPQGREGGGRAENAYILNVTPPTQLTLEEVESPTLKAEAQFRGPRKHSSGVVPKNREKEREKTPTGTNVPVSRVAARHTRVPDPLFSDLVGAKGWDLHRITASERAQANRAAKQLRSVNPSHDVVAGFLAWWRWRYPDAAEPSLEKWPSHWSDYARDLRVGPRGLGRPRGRDPAVETQLRAEALRRMENAKGGLGEGERGEDGHRNVAGVLPAHGSPPVLGESVGG